MKGKKKKNMINSFPLFSFHVDNNGSLFISMNFKSISTKYFKVFKALIYIFKNFGSLKQGFLYDCSFDIISLQNLYKYRFVTMIPIT